MKIFIPIIIVSFLISTYMTLNSKEPIGVDWNNSHKLRVIEYSKGDFSHIDLSRFLFQIMFVPLAWFNLLQYAKYFQIIFYVLAVFSSTFFIHRIYKSNKLTLLSFILILTSLAFLDRTTQLNPQAIDFIFYPFILFFYLKRRYLPFFILSILMIYTHQTGIIFLFVFFLHNVLFRKEWKLMKFFLLAGILSIPTFFWYDNYISSLLSGNVFLKSPEITQNALNLYHKPAYMLFYLGFPAIISLLFLLVSDPKRMSHLLEEEKLYLIWMALFIPLALIFIDRMIQYIVLPIVYLTISILAYRLKHISNYTNPYLNNPSIKP